MKGGYLKEIGLEGREIDFVGEREKERRVINFI
jgi:hypothetical protein